MIGVGGLVQSAGGDDWCGRSSSVGRWRFADVCYYLENYKNCLIPLM